MLKSSSFILFIILIVIAFSSRKFLVEAESGENYIDDINESEVEIPDYYKAFLNEAIRKIKNQENQNEEINLDSDKKKRFDSLLKRPFNPQTSINMLLKILNI
jgi:cell shape-determining protein MreC